MDADMDDEPRYIPAEDGIVNVLELSADDSADFEVTSCFDVVIVLDTGG